MAFLDYTGLSYFLVKLHNIFASKKSVEDINDETTGINLIRGSRDFVLGKTLIKGSTNKYLDGFNVSSKYTFSKDENGFTVANVKHDGTNWLNIYTSIVVVKPGDTITISVDFMTDDVADATYTNGKISLGAFEYYDTSSSSRLGYIDWFVEPSDLKSGEWKRLSKTVTVPLETEYKEDLYCTMRFGLAISGSIHFRKAKLEQGSINHPIWSPSPFDIDYINDETTGINLLMGTRDFSKYTKLDASPYGSGGFNIVGNNIVSQNNDDFAVATLTLSTDRCYLPYVSGISNGDLYTYSLEFMIDNIEAFNFSQALISVVHRIKGDGTDRQRQLNTYESLGFTKDTVENGKWYKAIVQLDALTGVVDNEIMIVGLTNNSSSPVHFRKACAYKGRINNPIWSASPFDYPTTEDVKKLIPEVSSGVEVATPSEVLNYIKGSTSAATIPSNGVLVGDLPEFEQEEDSDISTLPSEGRPLGGIDTSTTETEGDDKAWLM